MVKGRRLRGQALLALSRLSEAEQDLDTALRIARQVGNPCQLWQTYVACGDLRRSQGKDEDAHAAYHAALETIDRAAAALGDASLGETFLTSAYVQRLRQTEQACATPPHTQSRGRALPARPFALAAPGIVRVPSALTGSPPPRTARQAWAVERLRTTGPLSPRAYAAALEVSVDTALRDLQELVGRGLVRAVGTTKDRRYMLADEDDTIGSAIHRSAP